MNQVSTMQRSSFSASVSELGFPECNPSATCGSIKHQLLASWFRDGYFQYDDYVLFCTTWWFSKQLFGKSVQYTECSRAIQNWQWPYFKPKCVDSQAVCELS
jgi:hypothetical protein